MTLKKMMIVPMLAMAFFATGCGADCESQCEDAKECKGAEKGGDCAKDCEKMEDLMDKAGCTDQYDDVVSCISDQDDICKVSDSACKSEGEAWVKCYTKYCTDHASECTDVFGDGT